MALFRYEPSEIKIQKEYKESLQRFKDTVTKVTMEMVDKSKGVPVIHYGKEFVEVAKGVRGIKCSLDNETELTTILNVVFNAGAELGKHLHSEQTEYIFVAEGDLYVKLCDEGIVTEHFLKTGDSLYIPPKVAHYCNSERGALLTVTWQPKFH